MGFWDWLTGKQETPAAPMEQALPKAPTADDILASLAEVDAMVASAAVPAVVTARVHHISDTVRATLPRLDNLGLGSIDSYSMMATATDYLPGAIDGYTRLPRDWADTRPVESGKTSLLLLIDQLDLLSVTMDNIADAVNRTDANALVTHGRFLQEKFGHVTTPVTMEPPETRSSNPLDLG